MLTEVGTHLKSRFRFHEFFETVIERVTDLRWPIQDDSFPASQQHLCGVLKALIPTFAQIEMKLPAMPALRHRVVVYLRLREIHWCDSYAVK